MLTLQQQESAVSSVSLKTSQPCKLWISCSYCQFVPNLLVLTWYRSVVRLQTKDHPFAWSFFYQTSMKTPRGLHDIQSFNTQWTGCIYIWGLHVFAHQHYSAYRRHKAPNVGNVVYAGFLSCFHPQAFQHKSELKLRFMLLLPSSAWYQVLQTKKKSPSDDTVRSDQTKNKKNKTWFV